MASANAMVAIVTGANCGLGLEVTRMLCEKGYHVIMACRSEEKAQEAIATIKQSQPKADVEFIKLDLSSLASVHQFAEAFLSTGLPLHLLINNAGVFYPMEDTTRHLSQDGMEMTMASNHIGHFLLTNLLLDCLKSTAQNQGEARVVVVTSSLHDSKGAVNMRGRQLLALDVDDFMLEKEGVYFGKQAYKNSKLANVLFTQELAERLQGTGVTANCMCPGFIPRTGLARHNGAFTKFILRYILDGVMKSFKKGITRSIQDGATDMFQLSTADCYKGISGKYYSSGVESSPSEEAADKTLQEQVWQLSATLTHADQATNTGLVTSGAT